MPLEDNMKMLGMRNHYLFDYKVRHHSVMRLCDQ